MRSLLGAPMSERRRYAEGTTVEVDKTQGEIRRLLASFDCDGFGFYESRTEAHIGFTLEGRQYRFSVIRPGADDVKVSRGSSHHSWEDLTQRAIDAEWRRRWRARFLWLKATLEFADEEGEVSTALAGFLVLQGGRTVAEAIEVGHLPLLGSGS